jgi:hypothetical protein
MGQTRAATPRVADDLRQYVFNLSKSFPGYYTKDGCVGNLAKCYERFDMPLRFTPVVGKAVHVERA